MGAWIEICRGINAQAKGLVALCVGAWIEIIGWKGIKTAEIVALCVGAWIEIQNRLTTY